jgi:hypothetical protein
MAQAMTAEHHRQLQAAGVPQGEIDQLKALNLSINWAALVQWVMTDGIGVITRLLAIFSVTPAPTPVVPPVQT